MRTVCKETGHIQRDHRETSGNTRTISKPDIVGAKADVGSMKDLSEEELECSWQIRSCSRTEVFSESEMEVFIEGAPARALVDTGAQSTAIF